MDDIPLDWLEPSTGYCNHCQNRVCATSSFFHNTAIQLAISFGFCVKTSLHVKPFIWKWVSPADSFSCISNSFSYETFSTRTRFDTEAQGNSEIAFYSPTKWWASEIKHVSQIVQEKDLCKAISTSVNCWLLRISTWKMEKMGSQDCMLLIDSSNKLDALDLHLGAL